MTKSTSLSRRILSFLSLIAIIILLFTIDLETTSISNTQNQFQNFTSKTSIKTVEHIWTNIAGMKFFFHSAYLDIRKGNKSFEGIIILESIKTFLLSWSSESNIWLFLFFRERNMIGPSVRLLGKVKPKKLQKTLLCALWFNSSDKGNDHTIGYSNWKTAESP